MLLLGDHTLEHDARGNKVCSLRTYVCVRTCTTVVPGTLSVNHTRYQVFDWGFLFFSRFSTQTALTYTFPERHNKFTVITCLQAARQRAMDRRRRDKIHQMPYFYVRKGSSYHTKSKHVVHMYVDYLT